MWGYTNKAHLRGLNRCIFIQKWYKFERQNAWNLLADVPFAGALFGIKKFFAANKAINASAEGTDNVLKSTGKTVTNTSNCFVAGTEIIRVVDTGKIVGITALKFGGNPTGYECKIYRDSQSV
ncbi:MULTISPECIES: hypothetical protein [Nostocales]|uniref:Uncharacterized protein n=3 Tax=Nostocales TaxID=1161 RepID=A0A0C1QZZ1_9CYAN|nr:hypothetical protein [Tolypothrix bouteillei]KAF3885134.1 hypothetical protein DA73_0400006385 [Tolypothrix bouteillei VB521301]